MAPRPSAGDLFAAGNFVAAAAHPDRSSWHPWAALGLIGRTDAALEGLARFPEPEARLYSGVTLWIAGQDAEAEAALSSVDDPHARALLGLLRKDRIEVLAQFSPTRSGPQDLLSGTRSEPRFHVRTLPSEPYLDLAPVLREGPPPDFFVCHMLEWHLIPPGLADLPCPVLGATSDFDLHIQALYPWLSLFDAFVVSGASEWEALRGMVRAPVHTFPKCFGVPRGYPSPAPAPVELHLAATGTLLHPYHPDKARLVCELLRMEGLEAGLLQGFLPAREYRRLQTSSAAALAYCRWPDATHTKALEALAMGCPVLQPEGSSLLLFVGEDEGTVPYSLEPGGLQQALRRVLSDVEGCRRRAERGAERVRREFDLDRVASQHLRFLAFLASRPSARRRAAAADLLVQKRMVLFKGWGQGRVGARALLERNLERLPARGSLRERLDRARELALQAASEWREAPPGVKRLVDEALRLHLSGTSSVPYRFLRAAARSGRLRFLPPLQELDQAVRQSQVPPERLLAEALEVGRSAVTDWPDSLVARFNLLRMAQALGEEDDRAEAARQADEILARDPGTWTCGPLEDVFPHDFLPEHFNYRAYFDAALAELAVREDTRDRRVRLILAAVRHGRARDLTDLREACRLDPEFPYYRLSLARRLVAEGAPDEAAALLRPLALDSMLLREAGALLQRLGRTDPEVEAVLRRSRRNLRMLESYPPGPIPGRPGRRGGSAAAWFLEAADVAVRRLLQALLARVLPLRRYFRALEVLQERR